ncbi:MAG: hypothetical protein IJI13_03595, partial [Oscillospiraceae bacterium]|nr:hypothetical protein [Oscillospiraceae bacterium]
EMSDNTSSMKDNFGKLSQAMGETTATLNHMSESMKEVGDIVDKVQRQDRHADPEQNDGRSGVYG